MKNEMIKAIIAEIDMDVISVRYTKDTIWALSLCIINQEGIGKRRPLIAMSRTG